MVKQHLGTIKGERYRKAGLDAHAMEVQRRQDAKVTARDILLDFLAFIGWVMIGTGGACLLIAAVEARPWF